MVKIGAFDLFMLLAAFFHVRALLKAQHHKEAWVSGGIIGFSAIIGSMLLSGIELTSPVEPLRVLFEPLGRMILKQ